MESLELNPVGVGLYLIGPSTIKHSISNPRWCPWGPLINGRYEVRHSVNIPSRTSPFEAIPL